MTSTALANPDGGVEGQGFPASKEGLEEATSGALSVAMPEDAPSLAGSVETEDLDRTEAEELLQDVFGSAIEAPAEVFDELEVEEFRSDHVAVVSPSPLNDAGPGLLSSSLPLRVENEVGQKEVVDLDLEQVGADLEPDNPLVAIEIPTQLSDGISLPESSLNIELASAQADRSASTVGEASAFFPNVETDTDFVVSAAPTGVETFTHLRSPDAPTEQVFEITVPAGHDLQERPDGGARLVGPDGEVVLSVTAPSAIDAEGDAVPAALRVNGETLVVSVDPPADVVHPILVDPLFESFNAVGASQFSTQAWKQAYNPGFFTNDNYTGATVFAQVGPTTPGHQGYWNYYVPRYWSDTTDPAIAEAPTSYIRNIKLWNLAFNAYDKTNPYPFMQIGLWSDNKGQFVSHGVRYGTEGDLKDPAFVYDLVNPDEVTDVKRGGFSLATFSSFNDQARELFVGQASVEVSDKDSPGFGELGSVPEWVNDQAGSAINYKVTDPGLGIHQLKLKYPAATGGTGETVTSLGCTGGASSYCPRSASKATKALAYHPGLMAQGENWVRIYGVDPVGHSSTAGESRIKVDHTAPDLALSGNLTEQGSLGTNLPEYTLGYTAADGDEAAATALSPIGTTGTGSGQMQRPVGVAVDSSGNIWIVDKDNSRVQKYDKDGNFILQFGSAGTGNGQFSDPRGIAVSQNGTVWVAELGNKRLQAFNQQGQFIRTVTYAGGMLGQGKLVEPYAVATGPEEALWLTDIGSHRIYQFRENGTFVKSIPSSDLLLEAGTSLPLSTPTGIATDRFGNAWVAEQSGNYVLGLTPTGKYLSRFAGPGSGNGQLSGPIGVAIARSGNIFVVDGLNSRVQVFKPDGTYLRQFGSAGSGNAQLSEPKGIAVAAGNQVLVADASNHRIKRWSHADLDPQSGAAKVVVKVDGTAAKTDNPGCATKTCVINSSWTLDADDYSIGKHNVEVIATDGVGLATTKTLEVETHGDLQAPAVTLSGPMTQQASLGTTLPSYRLKVVATDPGGAEERKSGVASTSVKVDGVAVDSSSPGCPAGGCSITREWTLNSDSFSAGSHTVEVKATDAAGRSTTKTLAIEINRDTTAPEFGFLGSLYTAPSGWLEQKLYGYTAGATDQGGYGVTSVQLKIDGVVVKEVSGGCQEGSCERQLGGFLQKVDITAYDGGAHPAELIATDGAGNTRKRSWTINVVPNGQVPPAEAEDTLEALEAVSEEVIVAPQSPEEPFYPGPESESELKENSSGFHTVGAAAETAFGDQPEDGFTIDTADGTVAITPMGVDPAASSIESSSDISAISSNTGKTVDTIYRPIYDGAMTFQSIRTPTGTDDFSWTVNLDPEQYLEMVDDRTAQVMSSELERPVFTITAIEAHDAVGSTVPTTLSASGSIITLKVHHKAGNPAANNAPFVYPVIAGAGWEGGIVTYEVVTPPPAEQPPVNPETIAFYETEVGPPEVVPASEADGGASASSLPERRKKFARSVCGHSIDWVESPEGQQAIAEGKIQDGRVCGNGFDPVNNPGKSVVWRGTMRGAFFYVPGVRVRHRGSKDCTKGTPVESKIRFYAMKDAYECHFGPKTSDGNGGVSAGAGNYLRAQAHWELGERGRCWSNQPSEECDPPGCWMWQDRAIELHLWPSGNIDKIRLIVEQAEPC